MPAETRAEQFADRCFPSDGKAPLRPIDELDRVVTEIQALAGRQRSAANRSVEGYPARRECVCQRRPVPAKPRLASSRS